MITLSMPKLMVGRIFLFNSVCLFTGTMYAVTSYHGYPIFDKTRNNSDLLVAIKKKDLKKVKSLLSAGTNPNESNNAGQTPLMAAADTGTIENLKAFFEAGADLEECDHYGNTALFNAIYGLEKK